MVAPWNYVVFRDTPVSGAYHAVRVADSVTIATDPTSAAPVLQTVLNQDFLQDPSSGFGAGDVYVQPALYELGSAFAGLSVRSNTRLTIDPTAILQVSSGYGGPVFVLAAVGDASMGNSEICGGIIREAGPSQLNQWTAFRLLASPTSGSQIGVEFCKIRDTAVFGSAVGLELSVAAPLGFINANKFEFLRLNVPTTGVRFSVPTGTGGYTVSTENWGILYNSFADLQIQSDKSRYDVGIKDVTGVGNAFIGTSVWDSPLPAMTITPTADRTVVVAGALGGERAVNPAFIEDQGVRTKIL